ncbi:MAG: extracellular solute-binding protein [Anaerolineae bacterium]|nr:extracellular solute-binding protein [Anaerolineae bacterium]
MPRKLAGQQVGGRQWIRSGWALVAVVMILSLLGCDTLLGLPFQQQPNQNATVTPKITRTQVTDVTQLTPVEITLTPEVNNRNELVIWVPPMMDPEAGTPEGEILKQYLAAFGEKHPDAIITVRVKARSGIAGLMDSLISTSTAAPLALPSLIMLTRRDLEQAAKRGLILPMGDYSTMINELDWFQYARVMSTIGDSSFGLPFSGNALIMVYRPEAFEETLPRSWSGLFELGQPVYFAAANPNAALPMALYQSLGGTFVDEAGKPALDNEILRQMLTIIDEGNSAGVFPSNLFDFSDPVVIWNEYLLGNTNIVVTWANHFLTDLPEDSRAIPLIPLTDYHFTLAEGWLIALADPLPERRALAVELAESLVQVQFNSDWNREAGYLPMRSGSLELWENAAVVEPMELVSYSASPYPTSEISDLVAPILVEAVGQVLVQGVSPAAAAENAAAKLTNIEE